MTTQTQTDDRSPIPPDMRSNIQPTRVHRVAFWCADRLAYVGMETRLVAGIAGGALAGGARIIAQSVNPFWYLRNIREQRELRRGETVANALATCGIRPAEYAMLLWGEARLKEWESARASLRKLDRVDIGDMPRNWPVVRAIQDQVPWLKDLNTGFDADGFGTIDSTATDLGNSDPVQAEADAIASDLAAQGYSVVESSPDPDTGKVSILTDAPADTVEEAAVSAAIVQDAIAAEDVGPAPGTEPVTDREYVGNLGSARVIGGRPIEPMQQQKQREPLFPSATPKSGVAHADNGPGAQSQFAGADVAPVAETAGQAALREIGPEAATLAVAEIAREYGSPVIVADTPDGGASIAPVTVEGIAATARAMGDNSSIVAGIVPLAIDATPTAPQGSRDVSLSALTLAAGAFTLKPSHETAAQWRSMAKKLAKAGTIGPEELTRTRVATADFIPRTGQPPLRDTGKRHK